MEQIVNRDRAFLRLYGKDKGVDGAPGGRDAAVDAAGTKAVAF